MIIKVKESGYTPQPIIPSTDLVDLDGNIYTTVTIGAQEWTVENFKCTKFADSTSITDGTLAGNWNNANGAYTLYDPGVTLEEYGYLYSGLAILNSKGLNYLSLNGVEQTEWRMPTPTDWTTLVSYLGSSSDAALALRDTDSWDTATGTNSSGFTALAGGYRKYDYAYYFLGTKAYFGSKVTGSNNTYTIISPTSVSVATFQPSPNYNGYSVRFVKDV